MGRINDVLASLEAFALLCRLLRAHKVPRCMADRHDDAPHLSNAARTGGHHHAVTALRLVRREARCQPPGSGPSENTAKPSLPPCRAGSVVRCRREDQVRIKDRRRFDCVKWVAQKSVKIKGLLCLRLQRLILLRIHLLHQFAARTNPLIVVQCKKSIGNQRQSCKQTTPNWSALLWSVPGRRPVRRGLQKTHDHPQSSE